MPSKRSSTGRWTAPREDLMSDDAWDHIPNGGFPDTTDPESV